MNMYPLTDEVLMNDYKLNREPVVAAKTEQHRLMVEAGLVHRSRLSCQVCRSMWRLGHLMVRTGLRLEQRYAPPETMPA